jgi:hypothetical protein
VKRFDEPGLLTLHSVIKPPAVDAVLAEVLGKILEGNPMMKVSKLSALAASALLAATAAGSASAAALACKQKLGAAEKVVALNEINNLMGRYAHLGHLRGEDTLIDLFAMKQPDVSWRTPAGPQGPEAMKGRFLKPGEAPRGEVGGQLHVHSMLTPVLEIAADGKTAKGVWDSFGPNISTGTEVGSWLWVKYGVDFIREDDAWKIWHMQVYALFNTPFDKSITQSAWDRANPMPAGRPGAVAAGGPRAGGPPPGGAAMGGPNQGWKSPKNMWIYDGKTAPQGPVIPEPYCTFDPATSYGNI